MRPGETAAEKAKESENGWNDALLAGTAAALLGASFFWTWKRIRSATGRAPGRPGFQPSWNRSSKDAVGTALSSAGRVWFTLRQGAFTEIFHPRADRPAVRDLGLIVTAADGFRSDETVDADHEITRPLEGIPSFRLVNSCRLRRYRIEKTILAHPERNAVLQHTCFEVRSGLAEDYRLFAVLNPHLGNEGGHNTAWLGQDKGTPCLFARRGEEVLALACSIPWLDSSVGFIGTVSDGGSEIWRRGRLTRRYERAEDGNVVLVGEVNLAASSGRFLLSLGFGATPSEAAHHARASLFDDFESVKQKHDREWREWQSRLALGKSVESGDRDLSKIGAMVLRTHEDKTAPGAIVASLSVPWGEARSDRKIGPVGYHVVWPRDLVEAAGAFAAIGDGEDSLRSLRYLQTTQNADGHWFQNQRADGKKVWNSIQMGETGLPVLLADRLSREGLLKPEDFKRFWPMIRAAVGYIVRQGPSSLEDRWEDARGFTPYTLSVLIAALTVAAEHADANDEPEVAVYLRETADAWRESIDLWTYVENTELARRFGVPGYYIRVAPLDDRGEAAKYDGTVELWYRPAPEKYQPASMMVSPDALAYVRFGLRAADDPRILDTIKVVDGLLKIESPSGPCWHRYSHDGYGEQENGAPFDAERGIGRCWPLLTGERAHYELAAGRSEEALRLLHALESFAGIGGLIPEQVWDTTDIPERGLYKGRPSGSAMPLVWAHAEYLKLRRSIEDGRVFDTPPQTVRRYLVEKTGSPLSIWRMDHRPRSVPVGKTLRIELRQPAWIEWSCSQGGGEIPTRDTGLGVHLADLPIAALPSGSIVRFSLFRPDGVLVESGEKDRGKPSDTVLIQ